MNTKQVNDLNMVTIYRFKGKGAGKDSITVIPKGTWESFTQKDKDGNPIDKDSVNWRELPKEAKNALIEASVEKEPEISEKEIIAQIKAENKPTENGATPSTEIKKKFNDLIQEAEAAMLENSYDVAEKNYSEASKLLPDEKYPKSQLKKIEQLKTKA